TSGSSLRLTRYRAPADRAGSFALSAGAPVLLADRPVDRSRVLDGGRVVRCPALPGRTHELRADLGISVEVARRGDRTWQGPGLAGVLGLAAVDRDQRRAVERPRRVHVLESPVRLRLPARLLAVATHVGHAARDFGGEFRGASGVVIEAQRQSTERLA